MSDHYGGAATLEDWLQEEVFGLHPSQTVPSDVVDMFERWRGVIEQSIETWMGLADKNAGLGYTPSWRGWGRGYSSIPSEDDAELGRAIKNGFNTIRVPLTDNGEFKR